MTAKLPTGAAVRCDENVEDLAHAILEHTEPDADGNVPTIADPTPYHPDGPPGQTGDHNAAPLTRRHHRAKTHRPYQLHQFGLGAYRWITPHGLCRIVTPTGTRTFEPIRGPDGQVIGEIYDSPGIHYSRRE